MVDGLTAVELIERLSTGEVPEAGCSVLSSGGTKAAVRGDGDRGDVSGVSAESVLALEAGYRPHLDEVVPSSGDDESGTRGRREADAAHPVGVTVTVGLLHDFSLDVPEDELVVSPSADHLTVI